MHAIWWIRIPVQLEILYMGHPQQAKQGHLCPNPNLNFNFNYKSINLRTMKNISFHAVLYIAS